MKNLVLVGLIVLIAGLAALVWPAITFTKTEKVADLGPIHVTKEDKTHVPLPPVAGGAAVVAGVAMIVVGSRRQQN